MTDEADEEYDLPPYSALRGTEKQIAWAKKIREQKFNEMILHVVEHILSLDEEYRNGAWLEFRNTVALEIADINDSSFWIDNRNKNAISIFKHWPPTLPPGGKFHRGPKGGRGRRI